MAFVKLDTGILNSTLWIERECREVFITALLMAEPREFAEPQKQIEVRSLATTGWEAPSGWYGFVEAAGIGIVRRAMVEPDAGMAALEKLSSLDPESRSKDFGGRRLIRVDGGYLVLNFMKYRDRDYTAAARAQRYRDRLKEKASHRDMSTSHRDITQAEAEAEAEVKTRREDSGVAPALPPPAFDGDNHSSIPTRAVVALSPTFEISEGWGRDAEALGFPRAKIINESTKFQQYWTRGRGAGKRKTLKGWRQAWSNWLAKAAERMT